MTLLVATALALLGAVLASFTGVVVERLHTGQSWVGDRSRCNSCNEPLRAHDLVPVVSWLIRGGRARCCGAHVPGLYAAGEAALAALFVLGYLMLGLSLLLPLFLAACTVLLFIVLYDLRHTVVPQVASLTLLAITCAYAALAAESFSQFGLSLLVAGSVGMFFFLAYALSRGRAMGLGDAPVALSLSLLAGPASALAGLLFSFWIGAIVGIVILVRRPKGHRMGIEVPFVPFLAAGYLLAYFTQWNPLLITLR